MRKADFINPSGNLVKDTDSNGEYLAFIPNPLPPALDYSLIMIKYERAVWLLGQLNGSSMQVPNPRLFAPFMLHEALLSTRIEGTITTSTEVYAYQAGQLKLFTDTENVEERVSENREVVNYLTAAEYGLEQIENRALSRQLLRELHSQLLEGVRGEDKTPGSFRDGQNAIGDKADTLQSARFVPPPVLQMEASIGNLVDYWDAENGIPPLIRMALAHYQFEAIHPFWDGNGRLGRVLFPLFLRKWKLLYHPILFLSNYFENNRDEYNRRLYAVSTNSEWNSWILFFFDAVISQAEYAANRTMAIVQLQEDWRQRVVQIGGTARWQDAVEYLFLRPLITIPQLRDFLNVSWQSANNIVSHFIDAGILERMGNQKRNQAFIANEIINIFD